MTESSDLARLTDAARMLADAKTLPQIRQVQNLARRAQEYAKAARLGLDAQNSAAAIALEAEAKAGELLVAMKERGERRTKGESLPHVADSDMRAPTLAELGVTPDESSRWQQVAAVPAEQRAAYVLDAQEREQEVTRAGLLRHAKASRDQRQSRVFEQVEQAVFTHAELARRRLEGVVSLELLPAVEKLAADNDYLTTDECQVIEGAIRTLAGAIARKGLRVVHAAG